MVLKGSRSAGGSAAALLRLSIATGLAAAATPALAVEQCHGEPTRIAVVAEGLRSTRGDLVVEIYPDDAKLFLTRKAQVTSIHVKLESAPMTVCLAVPAPGGYGVAVFHDENGDRNFNRNVLGIPSEGFGLSNNPPIHFSMPSFRSVRFEAGPGETVLHVRMRYLTGPSAPP